MALGLGIIIFLIFTYSYSLILVARTLPSPTQLTTNVRPLTTQIYDRHGSLLYQIYEGQNRKLVKLSDLPTYLIDATVAIEDKNFYNHNGVDLVSILRAVRANLTGQPTQGGSTITQQLVKNTLLTPDKTIKRKIKEVILAFWAERIFSKDDILQMYFNEVPYGGAAWGIEAASETYFGKSTHELTLAEATYLAGLPAAPTEYSPYGIHPEKGRQRQLEVLRRMVEDHKLTQEVADKVASEQLSFRPPTDGIKAPHFIMYVRSVLAQKYGERVVSQGGLRVTTSLDLDIQNMAEKEVSNQVSQLAALHVTNGAAMVTDPKSGQILAMVGSKDYFDPNSGNYNVTLALRQPGSSIKVATYATAFKQGYTPGTTLLDAPVVFKNAWETYSPVNYDGKFHGPVPIRVALGSSFNIPAVKTLAMVGIPNMIDTAKSMGITTFINPDNYGLSLTLGGGDVKMIDMMKVYGSLADAGVRHDPESILKVESPDGTILEQASSDQTSYKAISPQVAYLLSNILSDNSARTPAFGPNSALVIPNHTVAVKTGTTDSKRDNWTFGYTPDYVVGVWVGNNDNSPMDPSLTSGVTGAAPIWHSIMANLLQDKPDVAFTRPEGVIDTVVDGHKDLAIVGVNPKTVVHYKKEQKKDDTTGENKELVTLSDQFSTYVPSPSPSPITN
ncbi:transglycosylase domain-containing protein [Candidatus Daviesbacteria bacterium]|nr:transglycosylase domain-containing protein [Candidatus Daviesbacteria bacterium]